MMVYFTSFMGNIVEPSHRTIHENDPPAGIPRLLPQAANGSVGSVGRAPRAFGLSMTEHDATVQVTCGLYDYMTIWVCLKMLCTPKPNGFADHYPYEKLLFHWEYTQHFQTNPYNYSNDSRMVVGLNYTWDDWLRRVILWMEEILHQFIGGKHPIIYRFFLSSQVVQDFATVHSIINISSGLKHMLDLMPCTN